MQSFTLVSKATAHPKRLSKTARRAILPVLPVPGRSGCEKTSRAPSGVLYVTQEPQASGRRLRGPASAQGGVGRPGRSSRTRVPRAPRDQGGQRELRRRRARPPTGPHDPHGGRGSRCPGGRTGRGEARSAAPGLSVSEGPERGLRAAARSWTRPRAPPPQPYPSGSAPRPPLACGPSAPPDPRQLTGAARGPRRGAGDGRVAGECRGSGRLLERPPPRWSAPRLAPGPPRCRRRAGQVGAACVAAPGAGPGRGAPPPPPPFLHPPAPALADPPPEPASRPDSPGHAASPRGRRVGLQRRGVCLRPGALGRALGRG
ncbi:basic proline-rich protein-like [Orcinus orca]|uniref:basic proline-rich protein-like n=1 Tax=Orcinus orca TaxID=9733 RepID=UPI00062B794D|nr:basic proline-rich protein-like [Orcinus orca]